MAKSYNSHRKTDSEKIDSLVSMIEKIDARLDSMTETMLKLWKAEDEEENGGKYRWPYDKNGNLLPNINITNKDA